MMTTLARVAFIIGTGISLRIAIIELQHHYHTDLDFLDLEVLALTLLPSLEIITLVSLLPTPRWILSSPRHKIASHRFIQLPILFMPGLLVNAAWRILEYFQSLDSCQVTNDVALKEFCDVIGLQMFTNVPFMILGTWAIIYYLTKYKPEIKGNSGHGYRSPSP